MKVEILEISAPELLAMLESQNAIDVCKLLIQTLALQVEKIHVPELQKEVANELVSYCEDLVFMSDSVIDSIATGPQLDPKNTPEPFLDLETKSSLSSWINNGGY